MNSPSHPAPPERPSLTWYWLPVAAHCALLFALSSLPGKKMPAGGFWQYDKLAHALVYGALGLLLYRALRRAGRGIGHRARAALIAVALATLYGLGDEWHQSFVPGRHASTLDLLADLGGAALFVAIAAVVGMRRSQSHARSPSMNKRRQRALL